jgi:hypothetical protein
VQGMGIVRTLGHGGHGATGRDPLNWQCDGCSLHGGHAEVHQQPRAQVHDLQAGEQLARKHRVQRPSGFDFDNDSLVDDQIDPPPAPPCSRCRCVKMMPP